MKITGGGTEGSSSIAVLWNAMCSDKAWQFLQTCIITFRKQAQLLNFLSMNKKGMSS
jgi:hypothetical protein